MPFLSMKLKLVPRFCPFMHCGELPDTKIWIIFGTFTTLLICSWFCPCMCKQELDIIAIWNAWFCKFEILSNNPSRQVFFTMMNPYPGSVIWINSISKISSLLLDTRQRIISFQLYWWSEPFYSAFFILSNFIKSGCFCSVYLMIWSSKSNYENSIFVFPTVWNH